MKATKGGSFKPIPLPEPQTALARCYSVVDLGTQRNEFKGEFKGYVRRLYITWEFPNLLGVFNEEKGEEPFVVGLELTASTDDKSNFGKLIAQWRNKPLSPIEQEGFDPMQMIGKTAFVSFQHKRKKDYAGKEISAVTNENTSLVFMAIMPKPKDVECPNNRNPYYSWDWDQIRVEGFTEANKAHFEKMPKWLQKKCSLSQEFKELCGTYKIKGTEDNASTDAPQPKAEAPKKTAGDDW